MRVVPGWVTNREVLTWGPQALMISTSYLRSLGPTMWCLDPTKGREFDSVPQAWLGIGWRYFTGIKPLLGRVDGYHYGTQGWGVMPIYTFWSNPQPLGRWSLNFLTGSARPKALWLMASKLVKYIWGLKVQYNPLKAINSFFNFLIVFSTYIRI